MFSTLRTILTFSCPPLFYGFIISMYIYQRKTEKGLKLHKNINVHLCRLSGVFRFESLECEVDYFRSLGEFALYLVFICPEGVKTLGVTD